MSLLASTQAGDIFIGAVLIGGFFLFMVISAIYRLIYGEWPDITK